MHYDDLRVLETTTTTGTGTLTVAGAVAGYRTLASVLVANGDTGLYYLEAVDANGNATGDYEAGVLTRASSTTYDRAPIRSSNSNALVNLAAGTKRIGLTQFKLGTLTPSQITANQNNYNPAGMSFCEVLRLTSDQTRKITGLAGGYDGRKVEVQNCNAAQGDGDILLTFEDGSSTAANRFALDNDIVLEPTCGVVLTYDGASQRWRCSAVRRKLSGSTFRLAPYFFTDFLGPAGAATTESMQPWDAAAVASGTQAKVAAEPTHPGILRITSSTTANSGYRYDTSPDAIRLAGGEVSEIVFRINTLTNLTLRMGFRDNTSSTDVVDGSYIEVGATGAAVGKTANNSTRTTSATIATLSAGTWYRARIVVNRDATAVDFYIFSDAGNLLGSQQNTANIPTAASRETGHGLIATNSGTTATSLVDVDWMSIEWTKALI